MRRKYSNKVVIEEDNAPWHTTNIITKYLDNKGINQMKWPPESLDLNPIKNLWNYIKDMISARRHTVKNTKEMKQALQIV
jgi:transposase